MVGRNYNLYLMGFWLLVLAFVLARAVVLPARVAVQLSGPGGWICGIVAFVLAVYNFARWWALRQAYTSRAVRVNPLAERLPDPDNPAPKWERNPELDFTKDQANGQA